MPLKLCTIPTCPNPARPGKGRCDTHQRELERERSARRRIATKGTFKTKRWEMLRRQVLAEQPICAICTERLSQEIDHIQPLSQGGAPYDRANVRGLCRDCHHERHRPPKTT